MKGLNKLRKTQLVKMAKLLTTNNLKGGVTSHGPFEIGFIEKWVKHSVEQNGDRVFSYEVIPF